MNENQENQSSVEQDPLSGAAAGIAAPKYPCLAADRTCRFEITKSTYSATKDTKDKPASEQRFLWTLDLKTVNDYPDDEGGTLGKGFTVYHRISMSPSSQADIDAGLVKRARTWETIRGEAALPIKACGKEFATKYGPKDVRDNPNFIVGQIVDCKIKITPAKGDFQKSNSLVFLPPSN